MPARKSIISELPEPEIIDVRDLYGKIEESSLGMVCVLGPTASGKTKFAVGLSRELSALHGGEEPFCEIISADSRQVYRGMDIGTGKDLDEYGEIPYHLIDIADAGSQYNVFRFKEDFEAAVADIRSRGKFPILCGGTGLYINAIARDYDFRSNIPLSEKRPDKIDAQNIRPGRVGNAGDFLPDSQETASQPCRDEIYFIGTLVDRETRNARIDARLDARLKEGMVEEVRGLLDSGVPESVLISYGLEYKFVTLYIKGELSYDGMREKLATAIHQFAKRQMTWFRGMERSGVRIHWTEV